VTLDRMVKLTRCILFDWGNTLMREFPDYGGPMVAWPHVEAIPHASQVLAGLHPLWLLALASNAAASDVVQIRAALERVSLGQYIDQIYCFSRIGHKKPSPEFFDCILDDLGIGCQHVVMVGDNFEADVLGANRSGIRAVWFNEQGDETRTGEMVQTIHDLRSLPQALETFGFRRAA